MINFLAMRFEQLMNVPCFSRRRRTCGARLAVAISAALFSCFVESAAAELVVSVNWKEFAGGVNDALDGYGVVPADNWHNLQQVTNGSDLEDSTGTVTTVDFSTTAPGGFDTFDFGTLNNTPMRAGLPVFANPLVLTLSDLASTFSQYDIIVYTTGFNAAAGGNQGSVTDGTSTFVYSVPNPYNAALVQSLDTDSSDGSDAATYVRFDGLTADSVAITLSRVNANAGIGGFQIVGTAAVPEPCSAVMLAVAGVGGLLFRQRNRRR